MTRRSVRWGRVRRRRRPTAGCAEACSSSSPSITVPVSALAFAGALGLELPASAVVGTLASLVAPLRIGERLRSLRRDDDDAAGDRASKARMTASTWRRIRVQVQGRRRAPAPAVGGAASAAARLADVVRRARSIRRRTVVPALLQRLLEGDREVLRLLAHDPFEGRGPRYLRASSTATDFADPAARRREGVWWVRERLGDYSPVLSLR